MRVYRFLDMHTSREANHSGQNQTRIDHRSLEKRGALGGDVIDISPEARERYEKAHVHEIETLRMKKLAKTYLPLVREIIGAHEDPRSLSRAETVREAKAALAGGDIPIEGREALDHTGYFLMFLFA